MFENSASSHNQLCMCAYCGHFPLCGPTVLLNFHVNGVNMLENVDPEEYDVTFCNWVSMAIRF